MSDVLHRAILDALRDAPGYRQKGILVSPILEATAPLAAHETLLDQAVYTIFCTLPHRLVQGSILHVATYDVGGGVQLLWEGREPLREEPGPGTVAGLLREGPHGDLLHVAMRALERFCHARSGFVDVVVEQGPSASAFSRPPRVVRRVLAFLPGPGGAAPAEPVRVPLEAPGQT
jgi:hypothetical protein